MTGRVSPVVQEPAPTGTVAVAVMVVAATPDHVQSAATTILPSVTTTSGYAAAYSSNSTHHPKSQHKVMLANLKYTI